MNEEFQFGLSFNPCHTDVPFFVPLENFRKTYTPWKCQKSKDVIPHIVFEELQQFAIVLRNLMSYPETLTNIQDEIFCENNKRLKSTVEILHAWQKKCTRNELFHEVFIQLM